MDKMTSLPRNCGHCLNDSVHCTCPRSLQTYTPEECLQSRRDSTTQTSVPSRTENGSHEGGVTVNKNSTCDIAIQTHQTDKEFAERSAQCTKSNKLFASTGSQSNDDSLQTVERDVQCCKESERVDRGTQINLHLRTVQTAERGTQSIEEGSTVQFEDMNSQLRQREVQNVDVGVTCNDVDTHGMERGSQTDKDCKHTVEKTTQTDILWSRCNHMDAKTLNTGTQTTKEFWESCQSDSRFKDASVSKDDRGSQTESSVMQTVDIGTQACCMEKQHAERCTQCDSDTYFTVSTNINVNTDLLENDDSYDEIGGYGSDSDEGADSGDGDDGGDDDKKKEDEHDVNDDLTLPNIDGARGYEGVMWRETPVKERDSGYVNSDYMTPAVTASEGFPDRCTNCSSSDHRQYEAMEPEH